MIGSKLDIIAFWNNFGYFWYASIITCTISVLASFISIIILCSFFKHSSKTS